ncbi:MAG: ABC transporter substrate-binding protein [Oscillospiraceae bacterium]|nr:ABC transporter substrate-binding protein [Oscillospiraceae bacterium]
MKRLMGLILSAALLVGLLAGCAGTPAGNNGTSTPDASGDTQEAAWPRIYVDNTGAEVVVEKQPERVAMTHFSVIEPFYALGVAPAAAFDNGLIDSTPILEPLRNTGIIELGYPVNLELLASVEPDLIIITTHADNVKLRDELEKIAPVIQPCWTEDYTLDDNLREYAKIVGKEAEAEKLIENKYAKLAEAREQLASVEDTVMIMGLYEKSVSIYGLPVNAPLYAENGLGLNAPEDLPDIWWEQSSLEALAVFNPDHIFIRATQEQFDQGIAAMSDSSVWNALTAVKNGQVYPLDETMFISGPLGVHLLADFVVEKLLK